MKEVIVIPDLCPANHPCPVINICPKDAIKQADWYSEPTIDQDNCTNCGLCTRYCGYGAFSMQGR